MFCRQEPPWRAACQAERVGSMRGPMAPTVAASTSRQRVVGSMSGRCPSGLGSLPFFGIQTNSSTLGPSRESRL
eukprot:2125874-Alexandrium_andersonii.AAC.1